MLKIKNIIKGFLAIVCVAAAVIANGSASANYNYQPKEPENLSNLLSTHERKS